MGRLGNAFPRSKNDNGNAFSVALLFVTDCAIIIFSELDGSKTMPSVKGTHETRFSDLTSEVRGVVGKLRLPMGDVGIYEERPSFSSR